MAEHNVLLFKLHNWPKLADWKILIVSMFIIKMGLDYFSNIFELYVIGSYSSANTAIFHTADNLCVLEFHEYCLFESIFNNIILQQMSRLYNTVWILKFSSIYSKLYWIWTKFGEDLICTLQYNLRIARAAGHLCHAAR